MMKFDSKRRWPAPVVGFTVLTTLMLAGCGNEHATYPVEGQIVYSDGSPATDLEGCTVTFEWVDKAATTEQSGVSGWGKVQADGTFTIGTFETDDGAVAGKHRVAISPVLDMTEGVRPESVVPMRYITTESSGLEVEITPGDNPIQLKIEKK